MDVVNSYRPLSFLKQFHKHGIYPTLITTNWETDKKGDWIEHGRNGEIIIEETPNYTIHRLPYQPLIYFKNKINSKVLTFLNLLKGNLDVSQTNNYKTHRTYIYKLLNKKQFDLVFAIFQPHYSHKLAYDIYKKFGVPYILDYQDLWENDIITKDYKESFRTYFYNSIIKFYWKKWLISSCFFTTTSEGWIKYLSKLSKKKGFIIRNGHEIDIIEISKPITSCFKVIFFGRIYSNMDLQPILKGIEKFLYTNESKTNILIEFIGLKPVLGFNAKEVIIQSLSNRENIKFIDYMSKTKLQDYCKKEASVFILPNFKQDNGQFMVKFYDYLSLGRPLILSPLNGGDLENILKKVKGGLATSSAEKISSYLNELYLDFNNKRYSYSPNIEEIGLLHRKIQTQNLTKIISDYLLSHK